MIRWALLCFCSVWFCFITQTNCKLASFANGCRLIPEGLSFFSADAFFLSIRGISDDQAMLLLHLTSCSLFAIRVGRHANRDQERSWGRADWGGVALNLEGKCMEKAALAFAWSLLSRVTIEQFWGGWAEQLDRREVGCWLEVGGIEFGFWRLDLWVLVRHLCWHCFCYCCCCRSCCWE